MKSLYLALAILALSPSLFAAPLSPADRDSIEQQQQQLLRQNQQQRDSLERAIPLVRPATPSLPTSSGPCFTVQRIVLDVTNGAKVGLPQLGWKKINETF